MLMTRTTETVAIKARVLSVSASSNLSIIAPRQTKPMLLVLGTQGTQKRLNHIKKGLKGPERLTLASDLDPTSIPSDQASNI